MELTALPITRDNLQDRLLDFLAAEHRAEELEWRRVQAETEESLEEEGLVVVAEVLHEKGGRLFLRPRRFDSKLKEGDFVQAAVHPGDGSGKRWRQIAREAAVTEVGEILFIVAFDLSALVTGKEGVPSAPHFRNAAVRTLTDWREYLSRVTEAAGKRPR